MTEAAAREHGGAAERPRHRLRRIPSSLVVTLLGIALTAWLLPAFTQQWGDRQKARDLKAQVDAQIANATANALIASRQQLRSIATRPPPPAHVTIAEDAHLEDLWLADSIKIEAKLRAYFDSRALVGQLRAYNLTMHALFATATDPWSDSYAFASQTLKSFVAEKAGWLGLTPEEFRRDLEFVLGQFGEERRELGITGIVTGVLTRQDALTDAIARAHMSGYSTSPHDLLRNLIPFVR